MSLPEFPQISLESIVVAVMNPTELSEKVLIEFTRQTEHLSDDAKTMLLDRLTEVTRRMTANGEV